MHTLIQSLATEGAAATEGGHAAYAWLLIALPALGAAILKGGVQGRVVVDVNG